VTTWYATQWVAFQFDYDAYLGTGLFSVGTHTVYAPWSLFPWWYQFDAYAPQVFNKGGQIAAGGLIEDKGVFLGRTKQDYIRHDGPEHVMAIAPTRSGKGVGLVIPTLLSWTDSAVIHDIKGENWQLTSGWRSTFSHCLMFDPTNAASATMSKISLIF